MRSKGREESQARARAGWGIGARHCSARSSPWHADGSPRRAYKEMAPRGEAERLQENQGWGAARARRVAGGLDSDGDHGSASTEQRREREKRESREREKEIN